MNVRATTTTQELTCQLESDRNFGSATAPYHPLLGFHFHVVAKIFLEQLLFVFLLLSGRIDQNLCQTTYTLQNEFYDTYHKFAEDYIFLQVL